MNGTTESIELSVIEERERSVFNANELVNIISNKKNTKTINYNTVGWTTSQTALKAL